MSNAAPSSVLNMFAPQPHRTKPLVEFKAGKMLIRGKQVVPDKRKGLIQLIQSPEDQLIHFVWKDRTTQQAETDLIIFPEDAQFKRVKQVTSGRVYLLQWKQSDRRMFFWMQEPSDEKDEEFATKINTNINTPPQASQEGAAGGLGGLAGMDQSQLMAMMGMGGMGGGRRAAGGAGAGGAASAASGGASAAPRAAAPQSSGGISSEQLSNILSGLGVQGSPSTPSVPSAGSPASSGAAGAAGAGGAQRQRSTDPHLSSVLSPDALLPLLSDPGVRDQLMALLPEGNRSPEELQQVLRSPQFQQALGQFNNALASGQLGQLMPMLGLSSNAAGSQGGVGALLRALQDQARPAGQQQPAQTQPSTQTQQQPQQPQQPAQTQTQPPASEQPPKKDDDSMDQSK